MTLHRIEGEPRVLDTDLAERLGMARPRDIRANIIEPNRAELAGFGPLRVERTQTTGRPGTAFYLNEEQATLVVIFSRTPKAAEARREIISVFTAWRRGELEQAAPKPALPDFSNPALAARAWADQFEARLVAQRQADERAVLLAEQEPLKNTRMTTEVTLTMRGGLAWADSREVAKSFEKEHRNVLRDISLILDGCSDLSDQWFQEVTAYNEAANKPTRHFEMTRDGFSLLAMGWTGAKALAFKVAYIDRFNAMEAALKAQAKPAHVGTATSCERSGA